MYFQGNSGMFCLKGNRKNPNQKKYVVHLKVTAGSYQTFTPVSGQLIFIIITYFILYIYLKKTQLNYLK